LLTRRSRRRATQYGRVGPLVRVKHHVRPGPWTPIEAPSWSLKRGHSLTGHQKLGHNLGPGLVEGDAQASGQQHLAYHIDQSVRQYSKCPFAMAVLYGR